MADCKPWMRHAMIGSLKAWEGKDCQMRKEEEDDILGHIDVESLLLNNVYNIKDDFCSLN